MIGYLRGKVLLKKAPDLIIDVNGIGYELQASMTTFYQLPEPGLEVSLYTHLSVREDAHVLYGFYNLTERELFRSLIKVNGVGPKLALAILSGASPDEFITAVMQQDTTRLTALPGIGKKTAERLIIEMRDRLKDQVSDIAYTGLPASASNKPVNPSRVAQQEAISALVALGYKPPEASYVINQVENLETLKSEEIIRAALKSLMKA